MRRHTALPIILSLALTLPAAAAERVDEPPAGPSPGTLMTANTFAPGRLPGWKRDE